jgi:hypothetical protein
MKFALCLLVQSVLFFLLLNFTVPTKGIWNNMVAAGLSSPAATMLYLLIKRSKT